jgi:hypothetical protein
MGSPIGPEADRIIDHAAALQPGAACPTKDQRRKRRTPYRALVGVVLRRSDGTRTEPMVLRARDISSGGVSVMSSHAIPSGGVGVMQIVRSDGRFALVGVVARHCQYAGHMEHRTGFEFVPMPEGFSRAEFLDEQGRMILLDPLLRGNCGL